MYINKKRKNHKEGRKTKKFYLLPLVVFSFIYYSCLSITES